MIEILVFVVPLVAFLTGATFGYRRTGSRQWVWLSGGVLGVLATAGACYLLSLTKTGGYLAGIVGAVMALVALVMAGAILAGALARGTHELIAPDTPQLAKFGAVDAGVMGVFALALVVFSAVE